MTITIDLSNPYVITTILFFAALGITNLLIQVKSIQLKRRLIMVKEPTPQLEAALDIIDSQVEYIEGMQLLMTRFGVKSDGTGLPERARKFAAKLRKDAGL